MPLIYLYSHDEPHKRIIAHELILNSNTEIVISTQVVGEFINILLKKFNYELQEIKIAIEDFKINFNISLIDMDDIEKALYLRERYQYTYWDSLIISTALRNNCTILYSEDLHDNQVIEHTLKITNPFKREY